MTFAATLFERIAHPQLAAWKSFVIELADSDDDTIPDAETLSEFGRLASDFTQDRDARRARKQAIATLPQAAQLRKEANAIIVPREVDLGARLVCNFKTLAELYAGLEDVRFGTASAPPEKAQRQALLSEAAAITSSAAKVLGQTCDPAHSEKFKSLRNQINDLQRRLATNEEDVERLAKLEDAMAKVDETTRGQPRSNDPPLSIEALQHEATKRLASFPRDTRARGEQAKTAITKAQAKITGLQTAMAKLQEEGNKLDCQAWSEPQ